MFAFQCSNPVSSSLNSQEAFRRSIRSFNVTTPRYVNTFKRRIQANASIPSHQQSSRMTRREMLQAATACSVITMFMPYKTDAESDYSMYKGPISLGFSFNYPSAWVVQKKPIKTHLSEVIVTSNAEPSTTAGLVVDAIKIDAIDKFGTPEIVGKKVVDVETKKDNVNSASVQSATSIVKDGLMYYVLDYTVDSSRGVKRYLAKATVTGNQLYVFTAQAKLDGFQGDTEETLSKMIDSFSVVKQYL